MRRFANMNNAARAVIGATAATVVVVAGITLHWPSSSAWAQPGSSPTALSVGLASDSRVAAACAPVASLMCASRLTVTENGVRFSFNVPRGWERHSSISTGKSAGGPISLNKSVVGSQGAEGIIYWTSFPDGDYADPCARLLPPSTGRSAAALATAVSRAPGTKLVREPSDITVGGRSREARRAHGSRDRRLRPRVLLQLAIRVRRCLVVGDGRGKHDPGLDRRRERDASLHCSRDRRTSHLEAQEGDPADRRIDPLRLAMRALLVKSAMNRSFVRPKHKLA